MTTMTSVVAAAADKVCSLVDSNKSRTFYDIPDDTLWFHDDINVGAILLFYRDVCNAVSKAPSMYKITDYELEPLGNHRYRMWFDLRPSRLTDL